MGVGALTAGVLGGGVFLLAGRKFSREHLSRTTFVLWASLLFGAALALRLWLGYSSQGFTTDTDTFKSWASLANQVGFSELYEQDVFLDYPRVISMYWPCWTESACCWACLWRARPTPC